MTVSTMGNRGYAPLTEDEILAIHQGVKLDDLQWFPDSSRIIFHSQFSGSSEFWSVSPEGGPLIRLTVGSDGTSPRVSPDGRWLSYISPKSGPGEVWIHPLDPDLGSDDRQLTNLGADVNSANWAPDGQSIVLSCNRYGSYDVYEVSVPDGAWRRLTSDPDKYEHYAVYTPDGRNIVYVQLNDTWEDHDIIQIDRNGNNRQILARDRDFFDYQMGRRFGHPLISPDGKWLLFRSHRSNWINYWKVDLDPQRGAEHAMPTPLCSEEFDQSAESGSITCREAAWSPGGRYVAYVSNRDGNVQLRVVSRDGRECVVVAAEEEGVASHPAWSPDSRRLAFLYQSFTKPPDVWVAEVEECKGRLAVLAARQLTYSMPRGLERKLIPPEKVEYASFDGTIIPGYVYRPRQRSSEPGPAIIEVQGGPVDQFRDTMQIVAQYLVQRGYTVLMPNRRGSAGYGKDFEEMIRTGWGIDDLQDIVAGAEYLAEAGLANPRRIGVTGSSYGGAMTMMLACAAPQGVFQASISRSGYADWAYYYGHGSQRTVKLLRHSLGPLDENKELYRKSSALNKVQEAQTPVFVIDQEADPTAPRVDQRQEFVAGLRQFDKPVRYRKYKNTRVAYLGLIYSHHPSAAKEMLPDMVEYFRQYLG